MSFDFLYPYVIVGLLLSVVWWFYKVYKDPQSSTILPTLSFWGATITYAFVLYFTKFSFLYKLLLMLPRDLIAVVIVGLLANNLKSARGYLLTAAAVGVGGYFLYSSYFSEKLWIYFEKNLPEVSTKKNSKLATDGEYLIDIKSEKDLMKLSAQLSPLGVNLKRAFVDMKNPEATNLDEYYLVDIPENADIQQVTNIIEKSSTIDWIEANEIVSLSPLETTPVNSTNHKIDYGINDPELNKQWGFDKTEVAEYFNFLKEKGVKPNKKAKIAILDTGVDSEHEDLKGNYKSTKKKYDKDKQSHGTHCAGIAAAVSNNGLGIASLNLNGEFTEITSIKVLSDQGFGTQADIIRGILEAADNQVDIISMSLGGPSTDPAQRAYEEAFKYANQAGAIIVVAAGNSNENARYSVPANCKGVITVSAINAQLDKASFSNTVEDVEMGIAAPGEEIHSTIPQSKYAAYSGTSMATPYVAGLLGVMKSLNPNLNTQEAYRILQKTGKETKSTTQTGRLVNPLGAIKALE
jgi:thermitase